MPNFAQWTGVSVGFLLVIGGGCANALPGQTTEEVVAWIQAHPTLRPASGETLLVRKSDTPAQRFTFQALTSSPGRAVPLGTPGMIRTEQISLFDTVNGVSAERLENSLRVIYGPEVYQDYSQAELVYDYPVPDSDSPLSLRGEVRQGDRYAYWVETAQNQAGVSYTGQISVFLHEDIDKVVGELQER